MSTKHTKTLTDEQYYRCEECGGTGCVPDSSGKLNTFGKVESVLCVPCESTGFDLDKPLDPKHFTDDKYRHVYNTMRGMIELEWSLASTQKFPVPNPFHTPDNYNGYRKR